MNTARRSTARPVPVAEPRSREAETFPSKAFPSETFPSETFPSETFPSQTSPSKAFPSETFPSQTFPSQTSPSQTFPSQTSPSQTSPSRVSPSKASRRWRATTALMFSMILGACGNETASPSGPPPLRPLLHTEGTPVQESSIEGYEEWTRFDQDPVAWVSDRVEASTRFARRDLSAWLRETPEGTIVHAFAAMVQGERRAWDEFLFEAPTLATTARMGESTANARAEVIRAGFAAAAQSFSAPSPTDARTDGLLSILQPTQVTLGPPRLIDGAIVQNPDEAVMYNTNTLLIHIVGTNIDFEVRFPTLLRDPEGVWRIGAPPSVGDTWNTIHELGLDLKPELMNVEHAPLPLVVGNYWHYDVGELVPGEPDSWVPDRLLSFRDSVARIDDRGLYRLVTLRRTWADEARPAAERTWLVTPRQVYLCDSSCRSRAGDLSWLLGYTRRQVPLYRFPLADGQAWGALGRTGGQVRRRTDERTDPVTVRAGHFPNAVRVRSGGSSADEYTAVVPGVGIVELTEGSGAGLVLGRLRDYRILR